ncbi:MAG: bifunctional hydroxymethylpyrimidine kinase/phosphomethylpyrimidine kinase [Filifactoraceae bacterium]
MKKVLTIAGSDSSGGAGIQADIKTITVHGCYALSAITALTAQNTTGVYGVVDVEPSFIKQQLDCIFKDIPPEVVKIGMVSNSEIIDAIAQKLIEYNAQNIILDPVMVSTSGSKLLSHNAIDSLINKLLPLGVLITPNIPEAEILSKTSIKTPEHMIEAATIISGNIKGAVLIKGGHSVNDATDLLYENEKITWFQSKKIETHNTHGTGCTLSSAIACNLAKGLSLKDSISNAKEYLTGAIANGLNLGKGNGPLNHMYRL